MSRSAGPVSAFVDRHFRHFNAAALKDAAEGYSRHLDGGGQMLVAMAGAMSTAELGISLAEMIRAGKVHAICCTGANLEEDVFNLVAHSHYERVPHYRDLTPRDEQELLERHLNRVTDTCIPEEEAMRRIERIVLEEWLAADTKGERSFPHEFCIACCDRRCSSRSTRSIRATAGCWRRARRICRSSSPAGRTRRSATSSPRTASAGGFKSVHTVKSGIEYMIALADWYRRTSAASLDRLLPDRRRHRGRLSDLRRADAAPGPAAAGRPAVGLLLPDQRFDDELRLVFGRRAEREDHVGQAGVDTPKFVIESDATIVAPLIFANVLGW